MPYGAWGCATVRHRAQTFRKSRAPLLPRRQWLTVAHRPTAPEPHQSSGKSANLAARHRTGAAETDVAGGGVRGWRSSGGRAGERFRLTGSFGAGQTVDIMRIDFRLAVALLTTLSVPSADASHGGDTPIYGRKLLIRNSPS